MKNSFKIGLVGVEFDENLSLRYLAGALQQAGFEEVHVLSYNSILDAETLSAQLVTGHYALVGVSMAFQVRAVEDLSLVELLRKKGFKGHITAGGQFATLHYQEIFADCRVDSIIRFEAETAIVQLAQALSGGESLAAVEGLVWQDEKSVIGLNNTSATPVDINLLPLPLRKARRPQVLGFNTAHMVGSRGCHATCKYCCVSALAAERREAGREAGAGTALAGTRRRSAAGVAAEMAQLYHQHEVRIFEFQDDNWIHPKISAAVDYFRTLRQELDQRGVGAIGISLKTRADAVQPEVLEALKQLGLIRVFVGIESGTQSLLSRLGRKSRDEASLRALQVLREQGIPAYFNALLFGPDIRFSDIEPELQFLEGCLDFPFEIVEVVIYGKTGLWKSLGAEGRLHGNYLDYDYAYLDAATQMTHTLAGALTTRHFGVYSPVKMAADLGFNLGVLRVFYPGPFADAMTEKAGELTRRINADQLRVVRKAADMAFKNKFLPAAIDELQREVIPADLHFYTEIIALQTQMEQFVNQQQTVKEAHAYYRAGSLVRSGLVAGLFLALNQSLQAQPRMEYVDSLLKRDIVNYILDTGDVKWRDIQRRLLKHTTPISNYDSYDLEADVMGRDVDAGRPMYEHLDKIMEAKDKINKLAYQRQREDFDRLNAILLAHQPKISIASSLDFELDDEGQVVDVKVVNTGRDSSLSPELRQTILDVLREKKFYAYESIYNLTAPPQKTRRIKGSHRVRNTRYKHRRQGPLD